MNPVPLRSRFWPEDALHAEYFAAPTDANAGTCVVEGDGETPATRGRSRKYTQVLGLINQAADFRNIAQDGDDKDRRYLIEQVTEFLLKGAGVK